MTAQVLWLNIPLMVLAFALMAGAPLWFVLRRASWHDVRDNRSVPAYIQVTETARATAAVSAVPRARTHAGSYVYRGTVNAAR